MTIVVGLVATDGLVVAADSQAGTLRGIRVKRTDYSKIYTLGEDRAEVNAIIAGAGEMAFVNKAVEELREESGRNRFGHVKQLEEAVEAAMVKLAKKYIYDRAAALGLKDEVIGPKAGTNRQFQGGTIHTPKVNLLIGAVDRSGQKLLASVGANGVAETEESYRSVGSGAAYAEYVLSRLWSNKLSIIEAIECAVYTIEEVKKMDPDCGGPVHVMAVTKKGIEDRSSHDVRNLTNRLQGRDELIDRLWQAVVLGRKSEKEIAEFLGSRAPERKS